MKQILSFNLWIWLTINHLQYILILNFYILNKNLFIFALKLPLYNDYICCFFNFMPWTGFHLQSFIELASKVNWSVIVEPSWTFWMAFLIDYQIKFNKRRGKFITNSNFNIQHQIKFNGIHPILWFPFFCNWST